MQKIKPIPPPPPPPFPNLEKMGKNYRFNYMVAYLWTFINLTHTLGDFLRGRPSWLFVWACTLFGGFLMVIAVQHTKAIFERLRYTYFENLLLYRECVAGYELVKDLDNLDKKMMHLEISTLTDEINAAFSAYKLRKKKINLN